MDRANEPGERRPSGSSPPNLERPPGERYERPERPQPPPSGTRSVAVAVLVALAAAVAIAIFGGALSMTAGLLVVAAVCGWAIGQVTKPPIGNLEPRVRAPLAAGLAGAAGALGHLGIWIVAAAEGGTLGLLDYLVATRGLLVPAAVLLAAAVAWVTAR